MLRWQVITLLASTGLGLAAWRASRMGAPPRLLDDRRIAIGGRVAARFVELLLDRDYAGAHEIMTPELRHAIAITVLKAHFEGLVPRTGECGEVGAAELVALTWSGRGPGDLARFRVPIRTAAKDHALTLAIAQEGAAYLVSEILFGH